MKKRIAVLGATGSIGRQTLAVIDADPRLELVAASSATTPLDDIDAPHKMVGGDAIELLERSEPDVVLNAIVGFAGLRATLWTLERGLRLALANKESLVSGGELALEARRRGRGELIPVDSEHSALFQLVEAAGRSTPAGYVLTASGGPFRGWSAERLQSEEITVEDALAHPTWSMGPKITVDSATLANKGLELIEAHFLFGVPYDLIEVVVHPSSIVHAMLRLEDGAALMHVGYPDMRIPISYALNYPERGKQFVPQLDFSQGLALAFEPPDLEAFPLLALAREAGEKGGTYPCAFNAANEVAVQAFLEGRLRFAEIAAAVEDVLARVDGSPARDVEELVEEDRRARDLVAVA